MAKFFSILVSVLLLTAGVFAQQAAVTTEPLEVAQGKQVRISITLSPIPTVPGQVAVFIAPDSDANAAKSNTYGIIGGSNLATFAITIGLADPVGRWTVKKVTFQRDASKPPTELRLHGEVAFTVTKTKPVIPDEADIQIGN